MGLCGSAVADQDQGGKGSAPEQTKAKQPEPQAQNGNAPAAVKSSPEPENNANPKDNATKTEPGSQDGVAASDVKVEVKDDSGTPVVVTGLLQQPEHGKLRSLSHAREMEKKAQEDKSKELKAIQDQQVADHHHRSPSANDEVTHDHSKELKSKEQTEAEIKKIKLTKRASAIGIKEKRQHRAAYEYMAIIGKGSFGQVCRVRSKDDPRKQYAMKILDIKKMKKLLKDDKPTLTRKTSIMAEEKVMQFLDHCFIVSLNEHFQTAEHQYLVLELIQGKTLADMIEGGKIIPLETARKYAAEIVLALSYVHDLKFVHRDLKPDNVMVARNGHIKLMDFGVALSVKDFQHSARQIGGKGFRAPEMLTGKDYDYSVDWWNFGCLLYLMLCGKHPFYRTGLFSGDEDSNALKGTVTYPKSLPEEARDLISKLLRLDPKTRLGSGGTSGQSHPEEIQVHPFFSGIDWVKLQEEGDNHRYDTYDNFSPDEKPQFADASEVMKAFDDVDPSVQLEKLGLAGF